MKNNERLSFLKNLYRTNSVMQFLVSYILVLIVPMCIMLVALQYTFSFVQSNVMTSSLTVLTNSKQLIDLKIDSVQTVAGYMVCNEDLQNLAREEKIDTEDDQKLLKALTSLANIIDARGIDLLDSSYVVLRKPKCVLYKRGLYFEEAFKPYITQYGLNFSSWQSLYLNYEKQLPCFSPTKYGFDYIVPFGIARDGKNYGVVVCNISNTVMRKMLGFSKLYNAYSFFLLNENNTVLWSDDALDYEHRMHSMRFLDKQGIESKKDCRILYAKSEKLGLNYVLVVSSQNLLERFNRLRLILLLLMMVAIATGLFISSVLAIKKGKPVDNIFDSYRAKYPEQDFHTMSSLEKLFKDLSSERSGGVFYPDVLEVVLVKNIKAANFDIIKSIILMIEKENFENRSMDISRFDILNKKICSTLKSFDFLPAESAGYFSALDCYAEKIVTREQYFKELIDFCKVLCINAGLKKMTNRKCLAEKIQQYLEENYNNPNLGLFMVAAEFSVSESYISKIYKEQLGINFADYLEKLRIEHALEILKTGQKSIKEVGSLVGYYSAPSFRRALKRVTGKTPKEYR